MGTSGDCAEREFLETLLGIDAGARMPGAVRAPSAVLHAHDGARAACHHARRVPTPSSPAAHRLPLTHRDRTTAASYTVFFDAIAAQGRALLRVSHDTADTSLTPPPGIPQAHQRPTRNPHAARRRGQRRCRDQRGERRRDDRARARRARRPSTGDVRPRRSDAVSLLRLPRDGAVPCSC